MQCIEKPGDELTFLKILHVLHSDGQMTLRVHRKHVHQLCSLLGMNPKTHNKRSLGHSDSDREDSSQDLSADAQMLVLFFVRVLEFYVSGLPHCHYVIRHLSTYSSKPTTKSMTVLRHSVAYLACHSDISISLKWTGRCNGIYHGHPDVAPCDNVLDILTDSDWVSDRNTRRSVNCCVMLLG